MSDLFYFTGVAVWGAGGGAFATWCVLSFLYKAFKNTEKIYEFGQFWVWQRERKDTTHD